ncbi:hypothetical protein PSYPI_48128, partial [Pseudomonas syringae pv. pisi str. 1704B]
QRIPLSIQALQGFLHRFGRCLNQGFQLALVKTGAVHLA